MFILQNNNAASVITSSQFGAIKFFLLGAPSKGLGRRGGREAKEGGDPYTHRADSLHCTTL